MSSNSSLIIGMLRSMSVHPLLFGPEDILMISKMEVRNAYAIVMDMLKRIEFPVQKKLAKPLYTGLISYKQLERAMVTTQDEFR